MTLVEHIRNPVLNRPYATLLIRGHLYRAYVAQSGLADAKVVDPPPKLLVFEVLIGALCRRPKKWKTLDGSLVSTSLINETNWQLAEEASM